MAKKKKNRRGAGIKRPTRNVGAAPGMGGMGGGGMGNVLAQVNKLQEEMEKTQAELAEEELTVSAGGGMVTVVISGDKELRALKIDPEVVDPEDVEMLEDLILAAISEAMQKVDELSEARLGPLTSGLGLPPGLGI